MTTDGALRVGLIGAGVGSGWGKLAHVPALVAAPSLCLHAVATSDQISADASARANQATIAFGDWRRLVEHPEVDLVGVAIRAPLHGDIVEACLRMGKPVYCEWPLGRSLAETVQLAELAATTGTPAVIGLQGRSSPWLIALRNHVENGVVGTVSAVTLVAQDEFSTGTVAASNAYMLDEANGANPLTVHAGHFLDVLAMVLGEPSSVTTMTSTVRTRVRIKETGQEIAAQAPDQVAVQALFPAGVVGTLQVRGGPAFDRSVLFEIAGSEGLLRVLSDGYLHWRPLRFLLLPTVGEPRELDGPDLRHDPFTTLDPSPAANVGRHYEAFARSLGKTHVADTGFALAQRRYQQLLGHRHRP